MRREWGGGRVVVLAPVGEDAVIKKNKKRRPLGRVEGGGVDYSCNCCSIGGLGWEVVLGVFSADKKNYVSVVSGVT